MSAGAMVCWIDRPLPEHLGGKSLKETLRERRLEDKPLAEQLKALGGHYKPWKAKDFFSELRQVRLQVRGFLAALHTHSYDGVAKGRDVGLRKLAFELGYCPRTLQNYIAQLEDWVPGFRVDRTSGMENVYRFTIEFLYAAGAILFSKPKPQAQAGEQVPSLSPTKNPGMWRLYMPDWLQKRQALRAEAMVGQGPEVPGGYSEVTLQKARANEERRAAKRVALEEAKKEVDRIAREREAFPSEEDHKKAYLDGLAKVREKLTDLGIVIPRAG